MAPKSTLEVNVLFPSFMDKKPFKGEAVSVSSKNQMGDFDVLPFHTNFITQIFDFLVIRTPKREIDYQFKKGVMEVKEGKVNIFLGL